MHQPEGISGASSTLICIPSRGWTRLFRAWNPALLILMSAVLTSHRAISIGVSNLLGGTAVLGLGLVGIEDSRRKTEYRLKKFGNGAHQEIIKT
jgi:hypothetical protein